jgi:acyl CoA:acetate/3-ketoacid CoA transferase beta subunit
MISYNMQEVMVIAAGKLLENNKSVFVGTGMPMLAVLWAQKVHAPNLVMVFEAGGLVPRMPLLPVSVGDSRTFHKAVSASSMHDVMSLAQSGYMDYGFLGGAQIDVYGNLNTTVIGDHEHPKTRLPGSGGSNDVGSFCWQTLIIMRQDKRKFAATLDYITSPGFLKGPQAREKSGLPKGSGPWRVITQLGVYGFDDTTRKMKLISLHPGIKTEDISGNSSFPIIVPDQILTTQEPTEEELETLRDLDMFNITRRK